MSRPAAAAALERFQTQTSDASGASHATRGLLASRVYAEAMPSISNFKIPTELPSSLDFSPDIYPCEASMPIDDLPAASPEQLKSALDQATSITFTSNADNQLSQQQPDFYVGADGILRANPNKTQQNADGSINIEVQSKNKYDSDAKKFADRLQKAAIKDLISYFSRSKPGAKIPQDWLDQLSKEPDLPLPTVPLSIPQSTGDGHYTSGSAGSRTTGSGAEGSHHGGGDSSIKSDTTSSLTDSASANTANEKAPEITNMPVGAWGGYSNGEIPDSALVKVYGFKVAPGVAENLTALLDAAQKDGVWNPNEPYATGTYRTLDQQIQLYAKQGPDWAATPGKSLHGWGEAIDFTMNNPQLISWLKDNAEKYGFKNHTKEPWHYSTSGG